MTAIMCDQEKEKEVSERERERERENLAVVVVVQQKEFLGRTHATFKLHCKKGLQMTNLLRQ